MKQTKCVSFQKLDPTDSQLVQNSMAEGLLTAVPHGLTTTVT